MRTPAGVLQLDKGCGAQLHSDAQNQDTRAHGGTMILPKWDIRLLGGNPHSGGTDRSYGGKVVSVSGVHRRDESLSGCNDICKAWQRHGSQTVTLAERWKEINDSL